MERESVQKPVTDYEQQMNKDVRVTFTSTC